MKKGIQGEGGGRPVVEFDKEQVSSVEKLSSVLTKAQLSDYFGIAENTFRAIEERQPEVFEAYKRGKAKAIANIASNLMSQAQQGNTAASMFYLKTQAGWKETDRKEITGVDGNPIEKDTHITVEFIGMED